MKILERGSLTFVAFVPEVEAASLTDKLGPKTFNIEVSEAEGVPPQSAEAAQMAKKLVQKYLDGQRFVAELEQECAASAYATATFSEDNYSDSYGLGMW